MIYDYFRVTGAHDTVLDHADLFSSTLRDDHVQEFDTRWDENLLSMTSVGHMSPAHEVRGCGIDAVATRCSNELKKT